METITPDIVRQYSAYTDKFLCDKAANIYQIKFRKFRVRDMDSDFVLFEVSDDSEEVDASPSQEENQPTPKEDEAAENNSRVIRYHLGPDFLDLKNIGSSLTFSVGPKPVKNFLMIERHYYQNYLVKSFEFKFDFCIPNSTNTWESIYTIPDLDPKIKKEMISHPWETKSDSFYFVEDKLIMHNKALYNYSPLD